ncbi:MAG: TonB-dependent receptor [Bacteroidales bacterium]|nr:TonB-dependent receptor [Bacteroidales bacterium]MDD2322246.1 TonB-dependent receptor [Bacteroidales bacterium]MDD3960275.1 TonB-dependent receptor [Bacteroidales bacterium]HPE86385.1 TonB-dependent receptor [Bacteroidales bacterium]
MKPYMSKVSVIHFGSRFASICTLIFLSQGLAFGQVKPDSYNEEVTIIAPYQPSVDDANKLNFVPEFHEFKVEKPEMNYGIRSFQLPTTYTPEVLKPASILGEPIKKLYRNYLKGGIGNYWTPLLELYSGSLRSRENAFAVGFKHHSSHGDVKDYGPSQFSHNALDMNVKKVIKKYILRSFATYHRDVYHNYGFMPADYPFEVEKDSIRLRYQSAATGVMLRRMNATGNDGARYAGIDYRFWDNRFSSTEHRVIMKTGFSQPLSLVGFFDAETAGIDFTGYYFNDRYTSVAHEGILNFHPFYTIKVKEYNLKIGLGLHQLIAANPVFYLSPDVELQISVIPDAMKIFAGVKGGIEKNTLYALSGQNPFLLPGVSSIMTTIPYKAFGGVEGKIGSNIDLQILLDAGAMDNRPFFVNSPLPYDTLLLPNNAFSVVTDDVTWVHVHASFALRSGKALEGKVYGDYFSYAMTALAEPFHKPELSAGLDVRYTFKEKIGASAHLFYSGKQYSAGYDPMTSVFTTAAYEINPFFDISLGITYQFSKPLSFFLQANNLLNNQYEIFYGFPSQGINILAGASYAF